MHVMNNKNYPLAMGFIYTDKDIFAPNIYPREMTAAFSLHNADSTDFLSVGFALKHPEDSNNKKTARDIAYHRLVEELESFKKDYQTKSVKSAVNDLNMTYKKVTWMHHKKLLSFTVSTKEMMYDIAESYRIPREFTPKFFRSIDNKFIIENLTDEFMYDIIDTYVYKIMHENDALRDSIWN